MFDRHCLPAFRGGKHVRIQSENIRNKHTEAPGEAVVNVIVFTIKGENRDVGGVHDSLSEANSVHEESLLSGKRVYKQLQNAYKLVPAKRQTLSVTRRFKPFTAIMGPRVMVIVWVVKSVEKRDDLVREAKHGPQLVFRHAVELLHSFGPVNIGKGIEIEIEDWGGLDFSTRVGIGLCELVLKQSGEMVDFFGGSEKLKRLPQRFGQAFAREKT
jgi:hypothetical protein